MGTISSYFPAAPLSLRRWWESRGKNLHRDDMHPTTAITAQVKYLDWNFRCNFSLPTSRGLYRYNLQVQNTLGKQWTSNAHCPLLATSWKLKSKYRRIIRAPAAGISIMLSRCSPSLPRSPHLSVSLTSVWEHTAETSGNSQDTTDVRAAAANTQHNNEKSPLLTWQKKWPRWTFQRCVLQWPHRGGIAAPSWRKVGLGLTTVVTLSRRTLTV